jgi:hypothetical protein
MIGGLERNVPYMVQLDRRSSRTCNRTCVQGSLLQYILCELLYTFWTNAVYVECRLQYKLVLLYNSRHFPSLLL